MKKELTLKQREELMATLKVRFEKNSNRHEAISWTAVEEKLKTAACSKLWSLQQMEETGGEPDVLLYDENSGEYLFFDCSLESPKGRRSCCFDREAQESRKENTPENNATDMAEAMGISLLSEEDYRLLQQFGNFDSKTSSWIKTPPEIRQLGGALFADFRYETVFIYHNGASSYYAARGFRGLLRI